MPRLRLGTRSSPLARWQAEWVTQQLSQHGTEVELVPITTSGDQQQQAPIGALGTQGVFTKEIQRALLAGEVDLAVHSLKDLPTDPVAGLVLEAVPPRGPVGDCLVGQYTWETLPRGSVVGTGSLRRRAQLSHHRPDLEFVDVRGNVDTRLRKLDEGVCAALILAEAGLKRLGLEQRIAQVLPRDLILPAIGQGALGIEARADDERTRRALAPLNDPKTHAAVTAERSMLATLRGGCLAPIAGYGWIEGDCVHLSGVVLSTDGRTRLHAEAFAAIDDAIRLGELIASRLIDQGAASLIQSARQISPR